MLRRSLVPILCLAAGLVHATALHADDKAAILARLQTAATLQTLEDPSLAPWHLKLAVQLNDDKGKPREKGTIEEWWASPTKHKMVFTTPSYNATELRNEDGIFHSPGFGSSPYLLAALLRQATAPLPNAAEAENSLLIPGKVALSKTNLDCVMLVPSTAKVPNPAFSLFPAYCFDQDNTEGILRITYDLVTTLVVRNRIGTFQKRTVPLDTAIIVAGVDAAAAHLYVLETMDDAALKVFDNIKDLNAGAFHALAVALSAVHCSFNSLLVVPPHDRAIHKSGEVALHAAIGANGDILRVDVQSATDSEMAIAAVEAYKKFKCKPYLSNGTPTEVELTQLIKFNAN